MARKVSHEKLLQRVKELEREITRCKRVMEELIASEKQKKAILDGSIDRIRLVDKDMRIIWANETHTRELNIKPEDLVGQFCYKIFRHRDTQCPECSSRKAFESGKIEHTFLIRSQSGRKTEKRYLDSYAVPIKSESGDIVNVIQITRNITDRKVAEEALKDREAQLEKKSASLEEVNAALRVLLKKRDEDKTEMEEKLLFNVRERVLPFLEKLRNVSADPKQLTYIQILESNLNDIISPFSRTLCDKYVTLTPTEIHIANLVKEGDTTKGIADLMNLSPRTIEFHRRNIRKKLGLNKKKANLRSHLLAIK